MIDVALLGIGLHGPGLVGWTSGRKVLAGQARFVDERVQPEAPDILSPRERRRVSDAVRLALSVGQEAVEAANVDAARLPSVFGWAHGDGATVQRILVELATDDRYVSPKDFHHSVHNVAVGYWAIAVGSNRPCTSVTAALDTFPAALLKAMAQVVEDQEPVLLVICDTPFPEPLNTVCPVGAPFGVGLVLAPPDNPGTVARLRARYSAGAGEATPSSIAPLRQLWHSNAAARVVPLLESLARGEETRLQVPYGQQAHLDLEVAPC